MADLHPLVTELVRARKDAGVSRAALAAEMVMTRETLSNWETRNTPPLPSVERWAYSLGYRLGIATPDGMCRQTGLRRAVGELAQIRHDAGITAAFLAEVLEIDRSVVSRWESADRWPSLANLDRWASTLGCRLVLVARNTR